MEARWRPEELMVVLEQYPRNEYRAGLVIDTGPLDERLLDGTGGLPSRGLVRHEAVRIP